MKKKIAFVIQRYGIEVNGGAELHCRQVVERLAPYFDITVLTTCATDYYSWKNDYEAGESEVNGVIVKRFPVDFKRDKSEFDMLSLKALANPDDLELGEEWMKQQGPYSSELFDYIGKHQDEYESFVFCTYLYASTYFGMEAVKDKKKIVLIPSLHDEPPVYLKIFDKVFASPEKFIFHTEAERDFAWKRFGNNETGNVVAGIGVEFPKGYKENSRAFKEQHDLCDYIIYVGRIDESKGCKEMFEYFLDYKKENPSDLKLVLMGKEEMDVPKTEDILSLGFVEENEKFDGIFGAKFMIVPSPYESLSISLLEAFLCKKPVLVNGRCEVLKNHCLKSNGGLWYRNRAEFFTAMDYFLRNPGQKTLLDENGFKYVRERYGWGRIGKLMKDCIVNGLKK